MQVNLADLVPAKLDLELPDSGLLSIFAEFDNGGEPMCAVYHFGTIESLHRTDPPYDLPHESLWPHRIEFTPGVMLPYELDCLEHSFNEEADDAYHELLDRFSGTWSHETKDRIGGYPWLSPFDPFWDFFTRRAAESGQRIPNRKFLMNNVGKVDLRSARQVSAVARLPEADG